MQRSESRYRAALDLYGSTDLSVREICERTGTPLGAFRSYLRRCHRELMFARYGVTISPQEAVGARLRKPTGQSPVTHAKYRDAVMACDDIKYIDYNVSQIAVIFNLSPSGLSNQLRSHFPEILERRERERRRLGINDNIHRGMLPQSDVQYAPAVDHLRRTRDTIRETARLYNVSYSGLREHILHYYKELTASRSVKRKEAKGSRRKGMLTGNGTLHLPSEEQVSRYDEAVGLYRNTAMTQEEIAETLGLTLSGLRNYLRTWHPDLIGVRRNGHPATASKYGEAISILKTSGRSTAEVARELGLNPESFRKYLHKHEPELAESLGRARMADGRLISVKSKEKYAEAISLYESTAETLKSIAERLNIPYKSISGFIRRNCPQASERHKAIIDGNSPPEGKQSG